MRKGLDRVSQFALLAAGALAASLAPGGMAWAQAAPATAETPPETVPETVVVTGSRVPRNGYNAPTPVTVVGEAEIAAAAPANVADFVNDLPSVVGSSTPANSNLNISAGTAGINALNLRSLGANRTLVLLDGQRSVGASLSGAVDVNNFPQGLIRSVQIVTGGASAAYGSDAVSGVVNFVLDTGFEGFKGTVEGGETTYGDDGNWRINLTAGVPFAAGRGKLLLNAEVADREGIFGVPRAWNNDGWYIVNNPAYVAGNGQPERLVTSGAGLSNASPGGIITNTVLRGTQFGVNGAVSQFAFGQTRDPWTIGGDWRSVQVNDGQSLSPVENRKGVLARLGFDVTDSFNVFAQASYNTYQALGWTGRQLNQANITIRSDNAFIPASVRTQLQANNIASFILGSTNVDLPIRKTDNERTTLRIVLGAKGDFAAFGREIAWDAYVQRGETDTLEIARDITNNARLALAQDAVLSNGRIVCRSTLTDPNNGCVPLNRMGLGVATPEALAYVLGNPEREQTFTQDVAAVNVNFDAFSIGGRAVAVGAGLEHRREEVSGFVEAQYQAGWFVGNYRPTFGEYTVTEGYVEAIAPVTETLDLNAAVRATRYSTSGNVTTWKVGGTWDATPDLRLRATRSRDIRAPNLGELFQAGASRTNNLIDPFNNNTTVQFTEQTTGNLALKPEVADTLGLGFSWQPGFLSGVGLSVDYFDIQVEDGVGTVTAQTIVDRCFQGQSEYCAAIVRASGTPAIITRVNLAPFNFAQQEARGVDVEASWRFDLGDVFKGAPGQLSLRALATHYITNRINNGIDAPVELVGQLQPVIVGPQGVPDWVFRASASYVSGPLTATLVARGFSGGVYDNSFIECTSGCPTSTILNRTINTNSIDGALYLDASFARAFKVGGVDMEAFLRV
jgi:outer membrane receptor protein involved in Fe transport